MAIIDKIGAFVSALGRGDAAEASKYLAEDVVLRSPIFTDPCVGKEEVMRLLSRVVKVAEGVTLKKSFENGNDLVLLNSIKVGDWEIDGTNHYHLNDDGLLKVITVMWRPLDAVLEFKSRLGPVL